MDRRNMVLTASSLSTDASNSVGHQQELEKSMGHASRSGILLFSTWLSPRKWMLLMVVLSLDACGGGNKTANNGDISARSLGGSTSTYAIGGTVSGLNGVLILRNNGNDALSLGADGSFQFATALDSQAAYNVTISTQPTGQTCSVANSSGIATAKVTNIAVTCMTNVVGLASSAVPTNWFTVKPSLPDFMTLFSASTPSPLSSGKIQVLKMYGGLTWSLTDANYSQILSFLQQHYISLALEVSMVDVLPGCTSTEGYGGFSSDPANSSVQNAIKLAQRIKSLGGNLAYIAMDEPLYYAHYYAENKQGAQCAYSIPDLANAVTTTFQAFQSVYPNVKLGDIEPFPATARITSDWLSDYQVWVQSIYQASLQPLAFVHDDANFTSSLWYMSKSLRAFLSSNNIPYGLIWHGGGNSDTQWAQVTEARMQLYGDIGLPAPDQNIFQSWDPYPSYALPQTSPTTMTYLVNYFSAPTYTSYDVPLYKPVTLYRSYNSTSNQHMSTVKYEEGAPSYQTEKALVQLYATQHGTIMVPLYRCSNAAGQYLTTRSSTCEGAPGWTQDGQLGWVDYGLSTNQPYEIPLYRFLANNGDHFDTTDQSEGISRGYTLEGLLGYALPAK
jgi:hypothetical protein